MNIFRTAAVALVFVLACGPVAAQWQTPNYSVPVGQGAGNTGFRNAAPGTAGKALVSTGSASDPVFGAVGTAGGGTGADNSVNSASDVLASNGTNGSFVRTTFTALINAVCTASPLGCTSIFGYGNVRWWGAKCDGATHDEVAFQAALTAANGANAPLRIPAGANCILNADVTNSGLFVNTMLVGSGQTSQVTFLGNFGFNFTATASYYLMQDFSINCQSTRTRPCVAVTNAAQSTAVGSLFQHVRVNASGTYGWKFQNTGQLTFSENVIFSTSASGVAALYVDNSLTADVGPNLFHGNTLVVVSGATTYGIYQLNCGGTQNSDNGIGGYSYDMYHDNSLSSGAATGILDVGNQLDNFTVAGIYFNTAGSTGFGFVHVNVSGNTIHANQIPAAAGSVGIQVQDAPSGVVPWITDAAFNNNVIDTFRGGAGIAIASTGKFTVVGNSVADSDVPVGIGIVLKVTSSTCMAVGNVVGGYPTHFNNAAGCSTSGATN